MMAWDTLQKEAVSTPENCSKLSTILKNSLASSKHQLNDKVVNLMNKLIPNNFVSNYDKQDTYRIIFSSPGKKYLVYCLKKRYLEV